MQENTNPCETFLFRFKLGDLLFRQDFFFVAPDGPANHRICHHALPVFVFTPAQSQSLLIDDNIAGCSDFIRILSPQRLLRLFTIWYLFFGFPPENHFENRFLLIMFWEYCPPVGCFQMQGSRWLLIVEDLLEHVRLRLVKLLEFLCTQVFIDPDNVSNLLAWTVHGQPFPHTSFVRVYLFHLLYHFVVWLHLHFESVCH